MFLVYIILISIGIYLQRLALKKAGKRVVFLGFIGIAVFLLILSPALLVLTNTDASLYIINLGFSLLCIAYAGFLVLWSLYKVITFKKKN